MSSKMCALFRRVYSLVRRLRRRLRSQKISSTAPRLLLEIDNGINLEGAEIDVFFGSEMRGMKLVVCEPVPLRLNKHLLSSSFEDFYTGPATAESDWVVLAPRLELNRLQGYYWFPESGFLISKTGAISHYSILGQYGDPDFIYTGAVERIVTADSVELQFIEDRLHEAIVISDTSLIVSHYATYNFGHYLLDMVPLLEVAEKYSINAISRKLQPWHREYISLGFGDSLKVEEFGSHVYFLEDFYISNRHNAESTYCASPRIRDTFGRVFEHFLLNAPGGPREKMPARLYLSREGSASRVLLNRREVVGCLRKLGFVEIHPEEYSPIEQAMLFSNAKIVVSEFGAVMANVVFCKQDCRVIELYPENQGDPWSTHLCAALGLDHIVLVEKVVENSRKDVILGNKSLDNIEFGFNCDLRRLLDSVEVSLSEQIGTGV